MQIFFKSKLLLFVNVLFTSVLMWSCGGANNSWKIAGTIESYANKPVYISIVGKIDSTRTDENGKFVFEKTNQQSGFVKLALNKNIYPYINLFADSICNLIIDIPESQNVDNASIANSPISVELKQLYAWFNSEKAKYDSVLTVFKTRAETSEHLDTLRIDYISTLDSLQETQYIFLKDYITEHGESPEATTASFVSFDTETYKPLLASKPQGVELMNVVSQNMKAMYGNISFVEMYANSVRSLELQVQP